MSTQHSTRRPLRAAQAIRGGQAGRRHVTRTAVIHRQLDQIAPGVAVVCIIPVTTAGMRGTHVLLLNDLAQPLGDADAHRAAGRLLRTAYPSGWDTAQDYYVRDGRMVDATPSAPAALGAPAAPAAL
ncbi:hypothetical protein SFUL_5545 [Streptomyces microflavus DSM 40593]|uniref:Uncharacterized protein n=1 Tax=Streptomyces microflavus DSM 40593 TaxID=1303692 RepID=N0D3I5_STRMI|nr:hypothetical protein [Streptomyces microflavus]AGK80433.1 hypothetical protein SFUL_5545 [Streptomyces microflavus DSM 40593]